MFVSVGCCLSKLKSWVRVQSPQAGMHVLYDGASIRARGSSPPACGLWPVVRHVVCCEFARVPSRCPVCQALRGQSPRETPDSKFGPPAPNGKLWRKADFGSLPRWFEQCAKVPRRMGLIGAEVRPLSADLHRFPGQPRPRPFPAEGFHGRPKPPPGPCWCVKRESSNGIIRMFVLVWLVSPLMRSP